MTVKEIEYELSQMTYEEIDNWMIRNYGETVQSLYGDMERKQLIHEIAENNAQ